MSKLKLTLLLISGILLTVSTGLKSQVLVVQMKDGTEIPEEISAIQNLSFAASELIVSLTNGTANPYGLSEIQKLYFTTATFTDENPAGDLSQILLFPNPAAETLTISGIEEAGSQLLIIRPDGKVMISKSGVSGQIILDVSRFATGLYFILVNGTSSKFIKL